MKKLFALILIGMLALTMASCCKDKTESASETPEGVQVVKHDCDGGCGMKDVPVDKMTEIDGKFYCAGCAKSAEKGDHSGHDHN